jgi:hypothetical protein
LGSETHFRIWGQRRIFRLGWIESLARRRAYEFAPTAGRSSRSPQGCSVHVLTPPFGSRSLAGSALPSPPDAEPAESGLRRSAVDAQATAEKCVSDPEFVYSEAARSQDQRCQVRPTPSQRSRGCAAARSTRKRQPRNASLTRIHLTPNSRNASLTPNSRDAEPSGVGVRRIASRHPRNASLTPNSHRIRTRL